MRKIYQSALLLTIFSFLLLTTSSQNIEWEKRVGGSPDWASTPGIDNGKSVIALPDGSSVVLINSSSAEGEFTTNSGKRDAWLFKLNAAGAVIWKQRFGGAGDDQGNQVIATTDGGFIISGQTASYPGPDINAWIIKTDAGGNAVWNKSFGGSQADVANSVCQTTDGYIFTGHTRSNNGNLATAGKPNIHEEDVWNAKLDVNGNIVWSKIFGGFWIDQGYSIIPVADGSGFAIAGYIQSNDRDVAGMLKGWRSALVIKIDAAGTVLWKQTFGGSDDTRAYSIINIAGGGFAFAGTTNSNSGTIVNSKGGYDYFFAKLNAGGTLSSYRTYGGSYSDYAFSLAASPDGGFVLAGRSDSPAGGTSDLGAPANSFDSWVIKIDAANNKSWEKLYRVNNEYNQDIASGVTVNNSGEVIVTGAVAPEVKHWDWPGTKDENAFVIKYSATGTPVWTSQFGAERKYTGYDKGVVMKQAPDGNYYLLAATESNDGDLAGAGNKGLRDILIIKYDVNRNILWKKTIGGSKLDDAKDMKVTPDGGVVIGTTSYSTDGDLPGTKGNTIYGDIWVIKLSPAGVIEWKKNYGGFGDDYTHSIELAPDGGYVVAGHTWSGLSGDISIHNGESEAWVLKIDAAGNKMWDRSFGGTGQDEGNKVIATTDGGYALTGWTTSVNGDGTGNHGNWDAFVVKFDASGNRQWSKAYGGANNDWGLGIAQTTDGNLAITGFTNSNNTGDISLSAYPGDNEVFVMKISSVNGNVIWSKNYGSQWGDEAKDISATPDGNIIIVANSYGGAGLFSEAIGNADCWIVKLNNADGAVKWKKSYGSSMYDYVSSISKANNGGYLVTGIRNVEAQWDALEFNANGEIFAIKIADNEVQSATITTSGPTTFCDGSSVTLTVTSAGAVSYQWYKDGVSIAGAVNPIYSANATGSYSVNAINAGGGIATASVDVLVNPTPTFSGTYNAGDIKQAITFGGYGADQPVTFRQGMIATTDGGYVFTGQTSTNNNGDLTGLPYYGGNDVVVVKLDCGFRVQWKKTFGGSGNDQGYAIMQSNDGGYMVMAVTNSAISGDITAVKGGQDAWLIKLDASGNKQWQRSYGGTGGEAIDAMVQTAGGDYIGVGWTGSDNGDLAGVTSKGLNDMWILKIAGDGTILNQRRAGGSTFNEEAFYISKTNDGNYIMSGFTRSSDGDITTPNKGFDDGYIEKFDANLNKIWAKTYGGSGGEQFYMVKPTADGGYIIGTHSSSSANGDFSGINKGLNDIWLIKISSEGTVLWDRNYGGPSSEQGHSFETTADGGFIVNGIAQGNGGDVSGFKGVIDSWVLRLDPSGNLLWQKTYGGTQSDFGNVVVKNNLGEIIVLGRSPSVDGDLAALTNNGGNDFWLTRIADCSSQFTGAAITPASSGPIFETQYELTANAGTGYTYQWYRNNKAIAGAVNQTYNAVATGVYKVSITNGGCPGYSNAITLTFNNKFYVNDAATTNDVFTTATGSDANNGSSTNPFATIVYALSKVKTGDTIYVDAGTYEGQIFIDKGITIIGTGIGKTIIKRPATALVNSTAIIYTANGIDDVNITALTIDDNVLATDGSGKHAIIIQTGGSIINCELKMQAGNFGIKSSYTGSGIKTVTITGNAIYAGWLGIKMESSSTMTVITNNTIDVTGSLFGMGIVAGGEPDFLQGATITGNFIKGFNGFAIKVGSNGTVQVKNNHFIEAASNQPVFSVQNYSTTTFDATCNWYGTSDAEVIKNKINGAVTYLPWLTSGVDTSAATGFQPQLNICNGRQNKFYVNNNDQTGDVFTTAVGNNANNGFASAPFATINHAMSIAQSGDTIIVDAGSYPERLIVTKKLYFKGAYSGINPGTSLSRGLSETILVPSTENNFLEMVTVQVSNVSFDGFLFNGDNPAITGTVSLNGVDVNAGMGIYNNNLQADSLVIRNNIFKNFYRYAMLLQKAPGTLRGIDFTRNHIDNISSRTGRDGRAIGFFANTYGSITENTLTRVHAGVFIANHNVSSADSLVISSNTIEAYNNGVYVYLLSGLSSSLIIKNNAITLADLSTWNAPGSSTVNSCTGINLQYITTSKNISVFNNQVTGTNTGISVLQSSAAQNFSITGNSITQTPGYAISHTNAIASLDASCNWYGFRESHNVSPKVTEETVNHVPWLTNGTDTDVAIGFQPMADVCKGVPVDADIITVTNVTCNGAANGSIDALVEEGSAPFTYAWSKDDVDGFSTSEDLTNLAPGEYKLVVTDVNGSIDSVFATITEPDVLSASATGTNNVCYAGTIGTADLLVTGGTLPYAYSWSNGATTESLADLAAGIYSVTITDANGCTAVASYEVTQPTQIIAVITGSSSSCANTAKVAATGGTGSYTYLWSNGATTDSITSVPSGAYSVTVTDANGCTAVDSITLTANEAFNPSAQSTDVTCYDGANGSITVTNVNAVAPFTYSIDGLQFQQSATFNNLREGTYNVTVVDANGCTGFITKTIAQPPQLTVVLNNVQSTCFGTSTGAIAITAAGGTGGVSYAWTGNNGYTSAQRNISNLAAGSYVLTVTDNNGCTAQLTAVVPTYNVITVTPVVTNITCKGEINGSIGLTVTGGTGGGFSYNWSTGATTNSIANLGVGNYNVTITDVGSGCVQQRSFTITQPATIIGLSFTKTNATGCNSLGTITGSGTGGTMPYQYKLNNGTPQTSGLFTGLYAGNYTLTVMDANGCLRSSAIINITDNGGDQYESNNSKNQASADTIGKIVNARLAVSTDIADWFKFTTPTGSRNYTVTLTHPTVNFNFIVYAAGNNTPPLVPVSSATGSKTYLLNGNAVYYISITGTTLSYNCYTLVVNPTALPIARTSATGEITPASQIEFTKGVEVSQQLSAVVYPNPHNGIFNLLIKSPENGLANIELFNSNGQKVISRNVAVKTGDNIVTFNNIKQGLLLYKVTIGKNFVSGKVIGQN